MSDNNLRGADHSRSCTVAASAGTGKTYLLVTRLVRLLLAGARPEAILAVTFTRKAAAEMQCRLGERLQALATVDEACLGEALAAIGADDDAATRERARRLYEELLHRPSGIKTTTFHAFCQDILQRFPLEAGIAPGFELLETEAELKEAAWDALLSEAGDAPDGEVGRALDGLITATGGLAALRTALDGFLAHRSDWWAFTEGQAEPIAFARDTLAGQLGVAADEDPLAGFFDPLLLAEVSDLAALLGRNTTGDQRFADALARALAARQETPGAATEAELLGALRAALLTAAGEPRSRKESAAQAKRLGEAGQARLLALHQRLCERLRRLAEHQAALATLQRSGDWYLAGESLLNHYQRLKREQRLLDFADLEWQAYRLLNHADNAHWVQYKLDQRIDHLLVDEFQDTNPTQWRLLLPLLEELAAGGDERGRSVFLVGDAKQSIYRFRRAEPALFDIACRWLQDRLGADSAPLNISWRSSPAVMALVNAVFADGPLHAHLSHFTPHDTHRRELWGRVSLLPLAEASETPTETPHTSLRNPLQTPRLLPVDDRHLQEARRVAAQIRQLLDARTPVGAGSEARPLHAGDIMLLLQRRTHAGVFEQALREAGIPYSGADRGTLLAALEIEDMLSLLSLLATPFDDLALASLLRSPLFACSDRELTLLAADGRGGGWLERLQRRATEDALPPSLARAARLLERWQGITGHLPIHDLLDRIFCEGDVLARYASASPAHLRHRVVANLSRFLELALEVDSGRYPSLGHFIARLRELQRRDEGAPDEGRPLHSEPRVQIMTIHAAKGLEAPVVFLLDATNTADKPAAHQALVHWPADSERPASFLLLGRKQALDPFSRQRQEEEQAAQQRENANLLYVALTRARQLLFVSGCRPAKGSNLGWYGTIAERAGADISTDEKDGARILFSHGQPPASETEIPAETPTMPIDERLSQPLQTNPSEESIAPSQATASELQAPEPAAREQARLRGEAIHRMLQLLSEGVAGDDAMERVAQRVAAEQGLQTDPVTLKEWQEEATAVVRSPALTHLFRAETFERAWNEVPIQFRQNGRQIHGIIDRVVLREDAVWLIDYKTRPLAGQAIAEAAEAHRAQLTLYARGAARLWPGRRLRLGVVFTALPAWVELTLD